MTQYSHTALVNGEDRMAMTYQTKSPFFGLPVLNSDAILNSLQLI